MSKALVIVESPAKARTINKFLGKEYIVKSSVGHIKDLPEKELGVNIKNDFKPKYVVLKGKQKIVNELKKAAQKVDDIYLAPDPDREGEAIAWHIASEIEDGKNIFRVTFHEVTKQAVMKAFKNPGHIDLAKVDAQQARRILDRLVGYKLSPLLWKKIRAGLSAGRVQSVALRLVCEREREIRSFIPEEYWSITAILRASNPPDFEAKLIEIDSEKAEIKKEQEAKKIIDELKDIPLQVKSIKKKEELRHPFPPFITSTLQQNAFWQYNFSTKKTMKIAQTLYEGVKLSDAGRVGLITYMRTDSTRVSFPAIGAVRKFIESEYGPEYRPAKPRFYKSAKGAQQAHEAIRPTMINLTPEKVKPDLDKDQLKLYTLIWKRFVASQMNPAIFDTTQADIKADRYLFRANGSVLKFDGFLKLYKKKIEADIVLPKLSIEEILTLLKLVPEKHFTKPPASFTEATLVRELEKKGIGRPSTYAIIMSKIQDRNYIHKVKRHFVPTELGFLVTDMLVENFPEILNVEFTADMENNLDKIEQGKINWVEALHNFYRPFNRSLKKATDEMHIKPISTDIQCEKCGAPMVKRWGKNGFFLACSTFPNCTNTKSFCTDENGNIVTETEEIDYTCEKCGSKMVLKYGRYGRFIACSNYPKCKNIKSVTKTKTGKIALKKEQPIEEKCELCGKPLVEKYSRYGKFIACSGYPDCTFIKKTTKTVKCPRENCDGKLVRRKTKAGKYFYSCSNYPDCDFAVWRLRDLKKAKETQSNNAKPID